MCKHGRPKEADTSTLHSVAYGGCVTTNEQHLLIKRCLPEAIVYNGYGQTEAAGYLLVFNLTNPDHVKLFGKYPDSVGKPLSGYSYKVL